MWEILGFREWERNQCAKVIKEQQKERESSLKNRTVLEHTYLHKRFLENKWVMFGLLCLALIHDPHSIWFYSPSRFFIYKKQRKYRSHLFRPKKSNQIILVLCLSSQNFKVLSCSKWFFHRYGSFKVSFFSPFYNLSNEKKKNKKKKTVHCFICSHETLTNCTFLTKQGLLHSQSKSLHLIKDKCH